MKTKITVADLVLGAGGIITFLFSFLRFTEFEGFGEDIGWNAWSGDGGAFVATIPAILGFVAAVWIVLELVGVSLPKQVLTYSTAQMKGTWGIAAAGVMLAWIPANEGKTIWFWLMFLGSVAMAVGAVMALLGKGTETVDLPLNVGAAQPAAPAAPTTPTAPPVPPPPSAPPSAPSAPPPPPPPSAPGSMPPPPPPG